MLLFQCDNPACDKEEKTGNNIKIPRNWIYAISDKHSYMTCSPSCLILLLQQKAWKDGKPLNVLTNNEDFDL